MPEQNLGKGFFLLLIAQAVFMITGYLANFFLGRYLGPEKYGIYGIVIAIITIINLVQTSGMPQTLSKSIAEKGNARELLKKSMRFQIISSIILMLVFIAFSPLISLLLNDRSLTMFIVYSSFVIPFYASYALYLGFFNGLRDFKKQAITISIYSVMKLLLIILLTIYLNVVGAIIGFVISPLIAVVYAKVSERKIKIEKTRYAINVKKMFFSSLPILGFTIMITAIISIDLFFVKGMLKSNILTGYYNAAYVLSKIPYYLLTTLGIVLLPGIAAKYYSERKKAEELASASIRYLIMILVPITIMFFMTSAKLSVIFFSINYIEASPPLSMLSIAIFFATLFYVYSSIAIAIDKQKLAMYSALLGLIVAMIMNFILVPRFMLLGAAMATLLGSITGLSLIMSRIRNFIEIKINPKTFAKIIISSIISIALIYVLEYSISKLAHTLWLAFILYCAEWIVIMAIYFATLIILKEINKKDLMLAKKSLPQKFSKYLDFFSSIVR